MQINKLADVLKGVRVEEHKPSVPNTRATPKPERTKVTSNPARVPVNRQAARVIQPNRCWLSEPPKDFPPKPVDRALFEKLQADLKIERNDHARTRDELGKARQLIKQLRDDVDFLNGVSAEFRRKIAQRDETIRQLEDLKL